MEEMEVKTGKKVNEMVYVDLLAVLPSFQRARYGHMIMDAVKDKVCCC